uniref:Candidate secreted effector n=3 Tax=Meloidogyne TaxID=189290 RepID=A0A914LRT2_MELIC
MAPLHRMGAWTDATGGRRHGGAVGQPATCGGACSWPDVLLLDDLLVVEGLDGGPVPGLMLVVADGGCWWLLAAVMRPALGLMCLKLFGLLCVGGCCQEQLHWWRQHWWPRPSTTQHGHLEWVEEAAATDQRRTSSKNLDK